ncbi:ribbon-helix-helix protein, CopG family, partial [Candidatus Roizmanbacteria bacterium]|nr:ribbon-helix-helix protein, CopG family [Candidatus Roizmanbacteria bacterium]
MLKQLINFVIPEKLLNEVDLMAREDSRSRSELIREAVRFYLKEQKQRKDDFGLIQS